MKFNHIMVAAMMVFGTASVAQANTGTVNFKGSIVDAPCSISADSINQTVDLGQVSNAALLRGTGRSTDVNFSIVLENCLIEDKDSVSVTFTGVADDKDLLELRGDVRGAGLEIKDPFNRVITLNKATDAMGLMDGSNTLDFTVAVVRHSGGEEESALTLGNFSATAHFQLAYQ